MSALIRLTNKYSIFEDWGLEELYAMSTRLPEARSSE
jgi:hypothetical protein